MQHVLGALTPQQFLSEYWQKKPLLVRNAWPQFDPIIDPDELAGLACEEDVNARLVIEKGGDHPWQLIYGPLDESIFESLPEDCWTLLVNDVEKYVSEMQPIVDAFRFIPDWRIDDLMVSFAPKGGSVGPHLDAYDVFLLQAQGHRRWQISTKPVSDNAFIEGLDLKILPEFSAEQDWVLAPGDMLYLPPNIAHHGVAEDNCMTFSIGFRAPSVAEMLSSYAEHLGRTLAESIRYADPDLVCQPHPGEITPQTFAHVRETIQQYSEDSIRSWFPKWITEPKTDSIAEPDETFANVDAWLERFAEAEEMIRTPGCRFAFVRNTHNATLYVDGEDFEMAIEFVEWLCGDANLRFSDMTTWKISKHDQDTLLTLFNQGALSFSDDL